jgi:hypothetical protein
MVTVNTFTHLTGPWYTLTVNDLKALLTLRIWSLLFP